MTIKNITYLKFKKKKQEVKSYLDDCCFDVQFNPNSTFSVAEANLIKILSKIIVGTATAWWSILELKEFFENRKSN